MRLPIVFLLFPLVLLGCKGSQGGDPGPASPTHVVYSLDNDLGSLSTFWADPDGRLYAHNPSKGAVAGPPNPLSLSLDVAANRLYAFGGYGTTKVMTMFVLGTDGGTTSASATALPGGASCLCFDPALRTVYVLDQDLGVVDGYRVQLDGTLIANNPPSGAVPTVSGNQLVLDPTGAFLYAPGYDSYYVYRVLADGTLQDGNPAGGHFWSFPFSILYPAPSGTGLYDLSGWQDRITRLDVQNDGTLLASTFVATPASSEPYALVFTPSGAFAYCVLHGLDAVAAFRVLADGTLVSIDPVSGPAATGKGPVALALDPEGKTLYVANEDGGTLSVFKVNGDGTLASLQAAVPAGINPISLVVR